MRRAAAACAALLIAGAHGLMVGKDEPQIDNHKCKVMCQRFGMKALAAKNDAFKDIHHPNECVKKCDEVWAKSSLLQAPPAHPADSPKTSLLQAPPAHPA